jgi:hypothetical protein
MDVAWLSRSRGDVFDIATTPARLWRAMLQIVTASTAITLD